MPGFASFAIILCLAFISHLTFCNHILGVAPQDHHLYASTNPTFTCLDKSRSIPREHVNDNYCDCDQDGSDEPSTSACSHLPIHKRVKFYCDNIQHFPEYISTSFVHDGVCDCCDGSDEYHIVNMTTSCPNTCLAKQQVTLKQYQEKLNQVQQALRIREINIDRALDKEKQIEKKIDEKRSKIKAIKHKMRKLAKDKQAKEQKQIEELLAEINKLVPVPPSQSDEYGTDNEYLILKGKCFTMDNHDYNYTLCPFQKVVQSDKEGKETVLGNWGHWLDKYAVARYENGERCWQAPDRSTHVVFVCGTEEKITKIEERKKCFYIMMFETPCACTAEHEKAWLNNIEQAKIVFDRK